MNSSILLLGREAGSTAISGLDNAPQGILLWRSLLCWLGGIGIVALGLFILPLLRVGGMTFFRMESSDTGFRRYPCSSRQVVPLVPLQRCRRRAEGRDCRGCPSEAGLYGRGRLCPRSPEAFNAFGYAEILGLPAPLALFLALSLVLVVLLHFTRFGRAIFLSGQSESAARFAGIPVGRVQTITYVITGVSAAIAGLVMSAYFGSARVDLGSATLLPAVTAAVLGGASIYGGQGSILGTLIATFVIGYLQQGLQAAGVPSQISSALSGGLLVVAVALRHGSAMLTDFIAVARQKKQARAAVTSGGE